MNFEERNRRRVFRLRFPNNAMLQATIGGLSYEVSEIAELSIWVTANHVENDNGICTGVVHWSNGVRTPFTGELGRYREGGRIIVNVKGISMHDVIGEQRRLIARYPILKD